MLIKQRIKKFLFVFLISIAFISGGFFVWKTVFGAGGISDNFDSSPLNVNWTDLSSDFNGITNQTCPGTTCSASDLTSRPGWLRLDQTTSESGISVGFNGRRVSVPVSGGTDRIIGTRVDTTGIASTSYSQAGIFIGQDSQNGVQVTLQNDNTPSNIWASFTVIKNGVYYTSNTSALQTDVYLRIIKTGDIYKGQYSYDGLNYIDIDAKTVSFTESIEGIGVALPLDGGSRTVSVDFDYFYDSQIDAIPILIEDSISATSTDTVINQARIVWNTINSGYSKVEWGTVSGVYPNNIQQATQLLTSHNLLLPGTFVSGTTYYYKVTSWNAAGSITSSEKSFQTNDLTVSLNYTLPSGNNIYRHIQVNSGVTLTFSQ
ncbi:hypothetical protein KJ797_03860, partial [Patescibacteria group bacterium]|nr:hypothetical protein [Patescibacteria group bacterium]